MSRNRGNNTPLQDEDSIFNELLELEEAYGHVANPNQILATSGNLGYAGGGYPPVSGTMEYYATPPPAGSHSRGPLLSDPPPPPPPHPSTSTAALPHTTGGYQYDPVAPAMFPTLQYTPTPIATSGAVSDSSAILIDPPAVDPEVTAANVTSAASKIAKKSSTVTWTSPPGRVRQARPQGKNMRLLKEKSPESTQRRPCRPEKPKTALKTTGDRGKQLVLSPTFPRSGGDKGSWAAPREVTPKPPVTTPQSSTQSDQTSHRSRQEVGSLLGLRRLSTSRDVLFPPDWNFEDKCGPCFEDSKLSPDCHAKVRLMVTTDYEILANHHPRKVRQEVRCETRGGCTDPFAKATLHVDVEHEWKCKP